MTSPRRVRTVSRLRPFASTIFAEMTSLAIQHDAVNLGQGFPDTDGPAAMLEVARQDLFGMDETELEILGASIRRDQVSDEVEEAA